MEIITDPVQVRLIARTRIEWDTLAAMMEERGLEWRHEKAATGFPQQHGHTIDVIGNDGALLMEYAARGCYNSFAGPNGAGMGRSTNQAHVRNLISVGHGSTMEHTTFTFAIWNNSRGLTHELVRHRVGTAFSQASTRFRDESEGRFVVPPLVRVSFLKPPGTAKDPTASGLVQRAFMAAARAASQDYDGLLAHLRAWGLLGSFGLKGTAARKAARGIARSLLPIGTESPITLTVNARGARNILDQRASKFAEAEIREMAVSMWRILVEQEPLMFDDYSLVTLDDGTEALETEHRKV